MRGGFHPTISRLRTREFETTTDDRGRETTSLPTRYSTNKGEYCVAVRDTLSPSCMSDAIPVGLNHTAPTCQGKHWAPDLESPLEQCLDELLPS